VLIILNIILSSSLRPRRRLANILESSLDHSTLVDLLRVGIDIGEETIWVCGGILRLEERVEGADLSADGAVVCRGLGDPVDEGLGAGSGFAFSGLFVLGVYDCDEAVGILFEGCGCDGEGDLQETDRQS